MTDKEKWLEKTLKKVEALYYEACDHKLNHVSSALGMVEDTIMHHQEWLKENTEDHETSTFKLSRNVGKEEC